MIRVKEAVFCSCRNDKSTYPVRRLWHFLVTKKFLHDLFIRYIFKKKPSAIAASQTLLSTVDSTKKGDTTYNNNTTGSEVNGATNPSSIKIIHKDQEGIHSFCLNEVDSRAISSQIGCCHGNLTLFSSRFKRDKNMLALCTNKEIIEIDIKNLLAKDAHIDDECEMDILALQR